MLFGLRHHHDEPTTVKCLVLTRLAAASCQAPIGHSGT